MQAANIVVMILLIVGGINWGLVGVFNYDLVAALFRGTVGTSSGLSRAVFVVVGAAAIYGFALLAPLSGRASPDMRMART